MAKKGYGHFYFIDDNGAFQIRKLTGRKRKQVLINYLRRRSGRELKVESIAKAFNISVRSMQKLLKELEEESFIRCERVNDEDGKQRETLKIYIGERPRLTGKEMQIEKVCTGHNPLKLRTFRWYSFWQLKSCRERRY